MKLYGLENKWDYYGDHFRWYSKYNGARGPWCRKEDAERGGAEHEAIIKTLFNMVENSDGAQHDKVQNASSTGGK